MVCVLRTIVLAALLGVLSLAATAGELVVISSTDPSLAPGARIDGNESISIAAGASVVLVSADGRTIRLAGAYAGAPDPSGEPADAALVESLSRLITEQQSSPSKLAVYRGGLGKTPIGRPDLWGIDITRADTYCLRADRPPMLWWREARSGAIVELARAGDASERTRISWPQSKKYTPWPRALSLEDGRVYVVRFSSGDAGEAFSAHLMPPLEGDAHRAAWMAEKGCKAQALAVLAAIGAGEEL